MRISDQEYNRLRVLKTIRHTEPIARTQLARLTGLAGGTITQVTRDLVKREVVLEQRVPPSGRGRPQIELRLNPQAAHVLSASFSTAVPGSALIEIIDMRGHRIFEYTAPLNLPRTLENLARAFGNVMAEAIEASPLSREDIHCIGVNLPAIVDATTGTVYWMAYYPEPPFPFADRIESLLGIPVVVDTSANVLARAEHWFGDNRQLDNFTLMLLSIGMGSASYVDGMPSTGAHGIATEITHMKVAIENGRRCYCGSEGCLAAYCSGVAIVDQICALRGQTPPGAMESLKWLCRFAAEAQDGDSAALAVFRQAGTYFGTVLANHINASDPARLLICFTEQIFVDLIDPTLRAAMDRHTLPALRGRTPVEYRPYSDEWQRKGNAALALEQIYQSPTLLGRPRRHGGGNIVLPGPALTAHADASRQNIQENG